MNITIREQVLAALRNNPGLNSARIATMIGMTTKKISGPLSTLFADGLIEFEGKHGQRLYRLTDYGMKYAPETIPAMPKGNSKLVQRTEANVICQECRNSAAMRRVLMVWGEGRGMKLKMHTPDGSVIVESNLVTQFYPDFESGGEMTTIETVSATGETFSVKVKHSLMQVTGALATAWSVDEKKAEGAAQ